MAARSLGSLTISFGLVSIPVKLYTATEASRAISFNLLHKGCGSRLKQQYVCLKEDVPVPREDIVKGESGVFGTPPLVVVAPSILGAPSRHPSGARPASQCRRTAPCAWLFPRAHADRPDTGMYRCQLLRMEPPCPSSLRYCSSLKAAMDGSTRWPRLTTGRHLAAGIARLSVFSPPIAWAWPADPSLQ